MRLAFCGDLSNGYFISVFQGVRDWVAAHPGIRLLDWTGSHAVPANALSYIHPDAILLGAVSLADIPAACRHLPVVGFTYRPESDEIPLVMNDDPAVGRMAAKALLEAGYTQFFAVETLHAVAMARLRGFEDVLLEEGHSALRHSSDMSPLRSAENFAEAHAAHERAYRRFVEGLPRDSGVFCPLSAQAPHLFGLMRDASAQPMPEALGLVVGDLPSGGLVDADVAHVALDGPAIGWQACDLLHEMLQAGRPVEPRRTLIAPRGVEWGGTLRPREGMRLLEAIIAYCEPRLGERLVVEKLAQDIGYSRRSLEHKLRTLGLPSPYEHLTRLRVQRGEQLLRETDLSVERVAELCGFSEMRSFTRRFRERHGCPPSHFRRNARANAAALPVS